MDGARVKTISQHFAGAVSAAGTHHAAAGAARVLTRQNVPNLEPGQEVAVDTTVDWLTSHEFPPQFTVRLVWSSNARDASASNDTANLDSTRIDAVFVDQATRGSEDGPD
jgi:hypothetical protein